MFPRRVPGRLPGTPLRAWVGTLALMALLPALPTACTTPESRARSQSTVLAGLSAPDQLLARQGGIKKGFTREAVRIAWGAPDEVQPASAEAGPLEVWVYQHTFYGEGGGYFGVPRGLVYVPAEGRYHDDPDDFYQPPVQLRGFNRVYTEVPYRKAYFEGGRVVDFSELQSGRESNHPAQD